MGGMNTDHLFNAASPEIIAQDLTADGQTLVSFQLDDGFRPPTAKHRAVPTPSAARMLRAALPRPTSALMVPPPPVPHGLRCVPAKESDKGTDTSEVWVV